MPTADIAEYKRIDQHMQLPAQPTPLIGREQDVAAACALLRRADVRLLTLIGPGGVGKTRLALEAAAALRDDFAEICVVALAPLCDIERVASEISQSLGLGERSGQPALASLANYVRERELLLVLDNFEQVIEAADLLAELLAAGPRLKLLVTSRAALRLRGEHEYMVAPLALPSRERLPPLDALAQTAAVELFVRRARAARADFRLTEANAAAVAEICYRLDGLPLAIELAAARSKLLSPAALLARLDNRLALLTGGARDLPERQQTIRATIDWSYNLLEPADQRLFARLGVFVGGWTLEAAEVICGDRDAGTILDRLTILLDKSLVRQQGGADAEARFDMLETLREYALERLAESGEADCLRRRHAEYFLELAERAEPELSGAQVLQWLRRLDDDYENIRAALRRGAADNAEMRLRLGGALWYYWSLRSRYREGGRLLDDIIEAGRVWIADCDAQKAADQRQSAMSRLAKVLNGAGKMAEKQGEWARAQALLEEGLALNRELGDLESEAMSLIYLGRTARDRGDYDGAEALERQSLALARELGSSWGMRWALFSLGDTALDRGDPEQAAQMFEEGLQLSRQLGDTNGIAVALLNLGRVAYAQGDWAGAARRYEECLPLFRQLGSPLGTAEALQDLGRTLFAQGAVGRAAALYQESLELLKNLGSHPMIVARSLEGLAGLAGSLHQPERAARLFGAAEHLRDVTATPLPPAGRADYERERDAARRQLSAEAWADAWAAGRALAPAQMIAEACEVAQPADTGAPSASASPSTGASQPRLTARERQVITLIAHGYSNRQIGEALVITERTAEIHVGNILGKLGFTSRAQAAAYAVAHGLAEPPQG
jgi:predicted ATPase/DNA-binding CsgD family transcriptional regulator